MTFKLSDRYPGRVVDPTSEYPRGSFKNRSAPNTDDGTYLEQEWKNDERGFFEKIVNVAKITPNGKVDNGVDCQIYDGLMSIVSNMIAQGAQSLYGQAGGSSDAITVTLPREISFTNGIIIYVRAQYANQTSSPTLEVGSLAAKAIVKGNNLPLALGDIAGAGYVMQLTYDRNFDRWMLLNPAYGVILPQTIPVGTIAYMGRGGSIDGWLLMDNKEHDRSKYADLVSQCPDLILPGSSDSTFKLIDPRGYFIRVLDNGKGIDSGRKFGSLQSDAQRPIKGTFYGYEMTRAGSLVTTGAFYNGGTAPTDGPTGSRGNSAIVGFDSSRYTTTSSENRPKNYAFPLYVKY